MKNNYSPFANLLLRPTTNEINNTVNEYLNTDNDSYLCGSKFKIVRSHICNHWHTHVNHCQEVCTDDCRNIGLFHPWNNSSFYNDILKQLTEEIDSDAAQDNSLKTNSIVICSECKIPSNRYDNTAYDILRAHPHYRPGQNLDNSSEQKSSPWHDWAEVEYESGVACGKILLWCWIEFCSMEMNNQSYAMVQTLTGSGKQIKELTILESYDSIVIGPHQIQFIPCAAIKSVAYVLPSIDHDNRNCTEYDEYFCANQDENKHFIIIKPIEFWR